MKTKLFLIISIFLFSGFSFGGSLLVTNYDDEIAFLDLIKRKAEEKANPYTQKDDSNTPLHFAAWDGDLAKTKSLLKQGADPNAENKDKITPAFYAVLKGHLDIVELFLDKIDLKNPKNSKNNMDIAKAPLIFGQPKIAKLFLEKEKSLVTEHGHFILMFSALRGYPELMKFLIEEKKLNPNKLTSDSDAPIHPAAWVGNLEVIKYLVKKRADINLQDRIGNTPLHFAAQKGKIRVVKFLMEKRALINKLNKKGKTPLDLAYENGHKALASALEKAGGKRAKDLKPYEFL